MLPRVLSLVAATVLATGCMHAARVFLDIPEGTGQSRVEVATPMEEQGGPLRIRIPDPAPIEAVGSSDSVLVLLPSLPSGAIDWKAAWEDDVIRPRAWEHPVEADSTSDFSYDLYLSTGEGPEAYFPHSTHREWLTCQSCHPNVYRNGGDSYSGETAHEKESCGKCHGPVAFPIQSCEQCHESATGLPDERQSKSLGEPMRLTRLVDEQAQGQGRYGQGLDLVSSYPPAVFLHGPHRLRYQCRACHESPFPMESGATVMSQDDAHSKNGCGACHDGGAAFEIRLDACERCHFSDGT